MDISATPTEQPERVIEVLGQVCVLLCIKKKKQLKSKDPPTDASRTPSTFWQERDYSR